jgi:histidine triad (HIT) family protein
MSCIFCEIVAGRAPVSIVHEDDAIMAFMALRGVIPGEVCVIPKAHIDHFTDIPDDLAARIMVRGQRIARRMLEVYKPLRMGMIVHGFGVAHAHLVLVPQHGPDDLTSARLARIENGKVVFRLDAPEIPRAELDRQAKELSDKA